MRPKPSTRFLKQYIHAPDDHRFIGRLYDLSIVSLHFRSYKQLAAHSDCKYAYDVSTKSSIIVDRVRSLDIVGDMLWPKTIIDKYSSIDRFEWLNVVADVFFIRLILIDDCALILTNEVFETELKPRQCTLNNLEKKIPRAVAAKLRDLHADHYELRHERNVRFHHGLGRALSSDDATLRTVAFYEHGGRGMTGFDQRGRRINTDRYFKEGIVDLQRDFNRAGRRLSSGLGRLYDVLGDEFEKRFTDKFRNRTHDFGRAAKRQTRYVPA